MEKAEERKHAIAYYRVSTKGQSGEDKFGLDAQRAMVLEYCGKNNYILDKEYTDVISGAKEERPELDKIVYGDEVHGITMIIAKTDRLSRKLQLYFYLKMLLGKKGITLISTQEDYGSMGEFAPMLESFVMFVAEQERNNITKRTKAGRLMKAKEGKYAGGKIPLGYHYGNGGLEIDDKEKEIVIAIFRIYQKVQNYSEVERRLKQYGYKTKNGNPITKSAVRIIIKNRSLYEGKYSYGSVVEVKGSYEPILKEGEFTPSKKTLDWNVYYNFENK